MKEHSITAIIPLFNGRAFIGSALSSILRQTRPPDEILIVDDGSTDDGAEVAKSLGGVASTLRILRKENGGQASARNFGVQNSRGSLIALLDQDDLWYDDHLEALSRPFEDDASNLGWVYSNLDEIDRDGFMVRRRLLDHFNTEHPKLSLYQCLDRDMFVLPSASLISKEAFLKVGGFDERLVGYEDDDLFLRLFRQGYRNEYLDVPLSQWRIYAGSTSGSIRMSRSRGIYSKKLLELVGPETGYPATARRSAARRFAGNFIADLLRGVREGRVDWHQEAKANLKVMIAHLGFGNRLRAGLALVILGSYPIARAFYFSGLLSVLAAVARSRKTVSSPRT